MLAGHRFKLPVGECAKRCASHEIGWMVKSTPNLAVVAAHSPNRHVARSLTWQEIDRLNRRSQRRQITPKVVRQTGPGIDIGTIAKREQIDSQTFHIRIRPSNPVSISAFNLGANCTKEPAHLWPFG